MRNPLTILVVVQFAIYGTFGLFGFVAWTMAFSKNLSNLEIIVGEYFRGHLVRWTAQLPLWEFHVAECGFILLYCLASEQIAKRRSISWCNIFFDRIYD